MLSGKDPKTGQTMTEESIIYNVSDRCFIHQGKLLINAHIAYHFSHRWSRNDVWHAIIYNVLPAQKP